MNESNGNPTAIQGSQVGTVLQVQDPAQTLSRGGSVLHGTAVQAEDYSLLNAVMRGASDLDFMSWAENDMQIKQIELKAYTSKSNLIIEKAAADEKARIAALKAIEEAKEKDDKRALEEAKLRLDYYKETKGVLPDMALRTYRNQIAMLGHGIVMNDLKDDDIFNEDYVQISDEGRPFNTLEDRKVIRQIEEARIAAGYVPLIDLDDKRNEGGLIDE